jgi:radical SAM protein with 4Fe4S-binding SPASM domain
MDAATRKAFDATRNFSDKSFKAACYAPYVSMFFTTSGNVVLCCKSQNFSLGNVATERLDEIWNGQRYAAVRKAVDAYVLPSGCQFCDWQISGGDLREAFTHHFDIYAVDDAKAPWPQVMEFAVSNSCNLECVMCCGESSSRIRARRDRLPPLANVYSDVFYEDLRKYLPHLKLARFLGGEPFVTRGNYRIWDMMIADKLKTPCLITTNGTTFDERVERVLKHLPCSIVFSIDGATKATLEKIRVGARFEVLMENARRFIDYTRARNTNFEFSFCLMRENWHEFSAFLEMAESHGVKVAISTVVEPAPFSLYTLPPDELHAIVEQLDRQTPAMMKRLVINREVWTSNVESLRRGASEARRKAAMAIQPGTREEAEEHGTPDSNDHFSIAIAHNREHRREPAIEEALKTPANDARRYHALVLASNLLLELDRRDECDRWVSEAITLAPGRPEAYVTRAWLRDRQGRHEEGFADAQSADRHVAGIGNKEVEISLCGVAGILAARTRRHDAAERWYARLARLAPDDPRAFMWRGWGHVEMNRPEEALEDARAALRLAPNDEWGKRLESCAVDMLAKARDAQRGPRMSDAFVQSPAASAAEQAAARDRAAADLRGWSGAGVDEFLTDPDDVIVEIHEGDGGIVSEDFAAIGVTLRELHSRMAEKFGSDWAFTDVEVSPKRVDRTVKVRDGGEAQTDLRTIVLPRFGEDGTLVGLRILLTRKAAVHAH